MTAQTRPRPVSVGAEIALAFTGGVASFAVVSLLLTVANSVVIAILLGIACTAGVIQVGRSLGTAYAAPLAIAVLVAFDWYQLPPTHPSGFPNLEDLANLAVYLAGGVLVGEIGAFASRRAERSDRARLALAEEQAALRRVATLVAQGVSPDEVFAAVTREAGGVLSVDAMHLARYEPDGTVVAVAGWSRGGAPLPVGYRGPVAGSGIPDQVLRTGRAVRIDGYTGARDDVVEMLRASRFNSSAGAPVSVGGRLWGVMIASARESGRPLPPGTESHLEAFTELIATAISNADERAERERLTDEQAALRRVATLVARGSDPQEIFAAVAEEFGRLLSVDDMRMIRYEERGTVAVVVGSWGKFGGRLGVGTRMRTGGRNVASLVLRDERPSRVDDFSKANGAVGELGQELGVRSAAGAPIVVDSRVWGALVALSASPAPLPAGTEERLSQFTELVATAISNIQARADLDASRARLVEATDDERRRVVRDLHDGAQQRLVQTVLTLKLARRALERGEEHAPALVSEGIELAEEAMGELRELAHGILPSALTSGGLQAGVDALCARMPLRVERRVTVQRMPSAVEATAYFVVAEALTNVAKHAHATGATVTARVEDHSLRVSVRDDGVGGARAEGSGLQGLADRLEVLHGRLTIESPETGGTVVEAWIPIPAG
jgi:signal transduction histidine kinase